MKPVHFLFTFLILAFAALAFVYVGSPAPVHSDRQPQMQPKPAMAAKSTSARPSPSHDKSISPVTEILKLALDRSGRYRQRVDALVELPNGLNVEQIAQLRELMNRGKESPTVRNEALEAISRQNLRPDDLSKDLIRAYHNPKEDPIWVDFALQHMFTVYSYSKDKKAIRQTLLSVAASPRKNKHNFGGTALLSLWQLGKTEPDLARQAKAIAAKILLSKTIDQERAITAMQIARESGSTDMLDCARKLAVDKSALVRLRLSAIGTLGEMGKAEDALILQNLVKDNESRVVRVARYNLKRLRKRASKG